MDSFDSEGMVFENDDDDADKDEKLEDLSQRQHPKPDFPDTCPLCLTQWNSKAERMAHLQTHLPLDEGPDVIKEAVESLKRRIRKKYTCSMGWCDTCQKLFLQLRTHVKNKHRDLKGPSNGMSEENFEDRKMKDKDSEVHNPGKSTMPDFSEVCPLCPVKWESKSEGIKHVWMHIQRHQGTEGVREVVESIENQIGKAYTEMMGWCELCNKFCSNLARHTYISHRKAKKPVGKTLCTECGMMVNKVSFKRHYDVHHKEIREDDYIQCPKCPAKFKYREYLHNHTRNVHVERDLRCATCGKTFKSGRKLKRHEMIHSSVKKFQCTVCDSSFTQRSNLTVHMRQHTGEKPYACDLCEKAFTNNICLKNHKKKEHGIDWWKEKESSNEKDSQPKIIKKK